jgi:hypothetical protein
MGYARVYEEVYQKARTAGVEGASLWNLDPVQYTSPRYLPHPQRGIIRSQPTAPAIQNRLLLIRPH